MYLQFIILDGFGYDLVRRFRERGHLRLLHAPSVVIAPYPTLTDLCMEDALDHIPCRAFEAKYFDRGANRIKGGSDAYMAGENEPYNQLLQYRAAMIWDAIGYLWPWEVFGKEVNVAKRTFDRKETREVLSYFVSSAGVGTRKGEEGQLMCLRKIERFVNQVVWETHARTSVTIFSDHGHTYTEARQ